MKVRANNMTFKKYKNSLFLTVSFLAIGFTAAAFAENEATAQPEFSKIESIGLLKHAESGSLGNGVYHGSDRFAISSLISKIPDHNALTALQGLNTRLLLTSADTTIIHNNAEITEGADILTLRLESLLRRGQNLQAFEMVSQIDENLFYHPRLSKAAVLSMLLAGEKGLSCLESKALYDRFSEHEFWKFLGAYCTLSLSDANNKSAQAAVDQSSYALAKQVISDPSYKFAYTPESFERLSITERAILVADQRISVSGLKDSALRSIPPHHIQSVLKSSDLTAQQSITLAARAIELGMLDGDALGDLFLPMAKALDDEKRAPVGSEELSPLLKKVKGGWNIENRTLAIEKSMSHAMRDGAGILVPFLSAFDSLESPEGFRWEQIEILLRAYLITERHIPRGWADRIAQKQTASPEERFIQTKLSIAATLLSSGKAGRDFKKPEISTVFISDRNFQLLSYRNIIENIDNPSDSYARVRYIYENDFDPAWNKGYTMPPSVILDELELATKSNRIAEVVILSGLALYDGNEKAEKVYPGLIVKAVESLSAIGLKKQAKEVLAQAILDMK